jgi:hypothetical protein
VRQPQLPLFRKAQKRQLPLPHSIPAQLAHSSALVRKKLRRLIPYWFRSHEQRCAGCDEPHAVAVEARCVGCDRPFCQTCVYVVAGELFCKECHEEGGAKPWRRARSGKAS